MKYLILVTLATSLLAVPTLYAEQSINYNLIVDAIYHAEGGARAKKLFGVLSVPCEGYAGCRKVALNTVKNNHKRWQKAGAKGDYLEFLAKRYAPIGAKNDPKNLNRNWLKNVRHFLKGGAK